MLISFGILNQLVREHQRELLAACARPPRQTAAPAPVASRAARRKPLDVMLKRGMMHAARTTAPAIPPAE